MDAITPEDIERARFQVAFRGYETQKVDAFLQGAAESYRLALKDASENAYRNLGQEIGQLLQDAKNTAEDIRRKAQEDASTLRAEAEREATRVRSEADQEAREITARAEREQERRVRKAEEDIARLKGLEDQTKEDLDAVRLKLVALTDQLERMTGVEAAAESEIALTESEPESTT